MALPIFAPPVAISTYDDEPTLNILSFERGDGYTSEAPNGLNHIRRVVNIAWEYLTVAEAELIRAFLTERGGVSPFVWTPPLETVPLYWNCREWKFGRRPPAQMMCSMTLRQYHGLER